MFWDEEWKIKIKEFHDKLEEADTQSLYKEAIKLHDDLLNSCLTNIKAIVSKSPKTNMDVARAFVKQDTLFRNLIKELDEEEGVLIFKPDTFLKACVNNKELNHMAYLIKGWKEANDDMSKM